VLLLRLQHTLFHVLMLWQQGLIHTVACFLPARLWILHLLKWYAPLHCSRFLWQHVHKVSLCGVGAHTGLLRVCPRCREIQTFLNKIGDKDASVIGSRQWVGAIELGLVLQAELALEYRVIHVASGSEMPKKAAEIAAHFRTEGTPIMIGGGVLAYTLLGIEWDTESDDTAFLILDPHYTGEDVAEPILKGKWVGWKQLGQQAAAGGPLFRKEAFYNLLCPLRPRAL
jgi:Ufm1-specific protease 2